ncbi:MAG: hypothetical protein M3384_12350, partial [Acidobacteriota bacterium]|nr:hypothetical protein [Acidobacteriota bacterium]
RLSGEQGACSTVTQIFYHHSALNFLTQTGCKLYSYFYTKPGAALNSCLTFAQMWKSFNLIIYTYYLGKYEVCIICGFSFTFCSSLSSQLNIYLKDF